MFRDMKEAPKDGTLLRLVYRRMCVRVENIQSEGREIKWRYTLSKQGYYWDDKNKVWVAEFGKAQSPYSNLVAWCYYAPKGMNFDKEMTDREFNKYVAKRK